MPPTTPPSDLRHLQAMGGAGVTVAELTRALRAQFAGIVQSGEVTLEWPGGSHETPIVTVDFGTPVAPGAQPALTIYASGVAAIPYIDGLSTTQLKIGVYALAEPAKGTKQRVAWIVAS